MGTSWRIATYVIVLVAGILIGHIETDPDVSNFKEWKKTCTYGNAIFIGCDPNHKHISSYTCSGFDSLNNTLQPQNDIYVAVYRDPKEAAKKREELIKVLTK